MKKKFYKVVAAALIGVSSLFVLMGSYVFIHKPEIPEELRGSEQEG
ncbi:cyclic lactone autoinducer peptide [Paenibacillus sp. GCM10012307]|uniref:Cyclic lactone autoinducer peptide n=1 Tax=Paenibacillus roseus TaxID=2798579 RepID=A0A934JBQ7_9BACL|nr:cyclic lactone autoinducer peptide [Paenibacillus roseus]MBJ6364206.1 cyclic lactone autoinducer peptide [Paenibacillus roseus]